MNKLAVIGFFIWYYKFERFVVGILFFLENIVYSMCCEILIFVLVLICFESDQSITVPLNSEGSLYHNPFGLRMVKDHSRVIIAPY
jgi:hypothetical protein